MMQFVPMGGPADPRYYSPDRDVAHHGIGNVTSVLGVLAEDAPEPWLADYYQAQGVDNDTLGELAERLAAFFNLVGAVDGPPFVEAWPRCLLEACHRPSLMVFLAELGRTYLAAVYHGLREYGDPRKYTADQERVRDAVAQLRAQLRSTTKEMKHGQGVSPEAAPPTGQEGGGDTRGEAA